MSAPPVELFANWLKRFCMIVPYCVKRNNRRKRILVPRKGVNQNNFMRKSKKEGARNHSSKSTGSINLGAVVIGVIGIGIAIYFLYFHSSSDEIKPKNNESHEKFRDDNQRNNNDIENEEHLATSKPIDSLFVKVKCSNEYDPIVDGCTPTNNCGRFIMDNFVSAEEANQILDFCKNTMSLSVGGAGGPTILDLVSGALSYKEKFVNVYKLLESNRKKLSRKSLQLLQQTISKIQTQIEQVFGLHPGSISLTKPLFFSR